MNVVMIMKLIMKGDCFLRNMTALKTTVCSIKLLKFGACLQSFNRCLPPVPFGDRLQGQTEDKY